MATTCPNCGHKFIQRRAKQSGRVVRLMKLDQRLISNPDGIIETDRILKAVPEWSKDQMWEACSAMIRSGFWVRLDKGRYVKIRDMPLPKGEINRSDKRERMTLR